MISFRVITVCCLAALLATAFFTPLTGNAKEPSNLHKVTCSKWTTYEEDTARQLAHFFKEQPATAGRAYLELARSQARHQKIGYLTGLIDVFVKSGPAKFSDYEKEVDIICGKPEHTDTTIQEVVLMIAKKPGKAQ